ncbi:CDP-alcohol phosphatidyltransferase family protein [Candidatus Woesearchaeota archaeon]|nr:CDP-alcohol phosphatidyltransferase family protein [Candidatus Woesearchaeota archaeon]
MKHLNYFSEKESGHIENFKNGRTKWFNPIARFLAKAGITADIVSIIGFLMIFGFVYFIERNPIAAIIFIILHIVIDGIDGTVARVTGKDGNRGAFLDIICDHSGIFVATAGLIYYGLVNGVIGLVYIYLYTIMIIFTIIRNVMKTSPKIVLRTKYYVYLLYGVYAFTSRNYLNEAMIIFSAIMIISVYNDFLAIRKKLK